MEGEGGRLGAEMIQLHMKAIVGHCGADARMGGQDFSFSSYSLGYQLRSHPAHFHINLPTTACVAKAACSSPPRQAPL